MCLGHAGFIPHVSVHAHWPPPVCMYLYVVWSPQGRVVSVGVLLGLFGGQQVHGHPVMQPFQSAPQQVVRGETSSGRAARGAANYPYPSPYPTNGG